MNRSAEIANGILKAVAALLVIGIFVVLLYQIKAVFVYLLIALVLTLVGAPIKDFLYSRWGFSKNWSVTTTLLVFGVFFLIFIGMFIPLISTQIENLSNADFEKVQTGIQQYQLTVYEALIKWGVHADFLKSNQIGNILTEERFAALINGLLSLLGHFSIGIAATFFITFFLLRDKEVFLYQIKKYFIPEEHREKIMSSFTIIEALLSRYFFGLSIQLLIFFVVCYVTLLLFGVKAAIVIALISALLNIVPYIGPLIANLLASVCTLLTFIDQDFLSVALPNALYVCLAYIIIQFLDNNFLQPYIFANSVKSHPLEIFLVILSSGLLTGIVGMVVAVPLYTSVKVILKEFFPDNKIIQVFTKNI